MKNRYLITYESAHWCGAADTHCVVYAPDAHTAVLLAEDHMETEMRGLFDDEYSAEEESN